jgi:DNA-binding MarR family transcriptional regulator
MVAAEQPNPAATPAAAVGDRPGQQQKRHRQPDGVDAQQGRARGRRRTAGSGNIGTGFGGRAGWWRGSAPLLMGGGRLSLHADSAHRWLGRTGSVRIAMASSEPRRRVDEGGCGAQRDGQGRQRVTLDRGELLAAAPIGVPVALGWEATPSQVNGCRQTCVGRSLCGALTSISVDSSTSATGTLEEFGPASQAALGRRTGIDRSDVVAALNDLASRGLIQRSPDPADRRRNVITITPAGRRQLRRLDGVLAGVQDKLLAPLSPAERQQLTRLLVRIVENHTVTHRSDMAPQPRTLRN